VSRCFRGALYGDAAPPWLDEVR
jgi:hypothetical protein